MSTDRLDAIEARLDAVETEVELIKASRPGKKAKPLVKSEIGVCGLDPTRDSAQCEEATIYRYQKGCRGTRCVEINRQYYQEYREKQRATSNGAGV